MPHHSRTVVVPKNKHYPSMTAQDFQLIADVLASIKAERPVKETVIATFAEALAHTNPNFRPDRFRDACNGVLPGGKEPNLWAKEKESWT